MARFSVRILMISIYIIFSLLKLTIIIISQKLGKRVPPNIIISSLSFCSTYLQRIATPVKLVDRPRMWSTLRLPSTSHTSSRSPILVLVVVLVAVRIGNLTAKTTTDEYASSACPVAPPLVSHSTSKPTTPVKQCMQCARLRLDNVVVIIIICSQINCRLYVLETLAVIYRPVSRECDRDESYSLS